MSKEQTFRDKVARGLDGIERGDEILLERVWDPYTPPGQSRPRGWKLQLFVNGQRRLHDVHNLVFSAAISREDYIMAELDKLQVSYEVKIVIKELETA